MALRIYNTLTREKAEFKPIEPGKVRMYLCGITPYAPSHIGHARGPLTFDVVLRWMRRHYDEVTYVRNFTDIDDKIIKASNEEGIEAVALAARYIAMYHDAVGKLGCLPPTHEPRVSETIPEIIELIQNIEKNGCAYEVSGDVFFDVLAFPQYGRLSGRTLKDLDDLEAGARIDVDQRKRSPYDFALWKGAKPGEPAWDSPWGKGRPGWHIECSAMSSKFLGETFDIHGGGKDLVFPHHENEIAQSCAASGNPEYAHFWMHNGFVNLLPEGCPSCGKELPLENQPEKCSGCGYAFTDEDFKMSKSRGNFYPVHELLEQYEPEALRALLLSSHYRSPIAFSHALIADAQKRLGRVYETLVVMDEFLKQHEVGGAETFRELFGFDPMHKLGEAMDDDFNTAKVLAEAGELIKIANDLLNNKEKERIGRKLKAKPKAALLAEMRGYLREISDVLGLWSERPEDFLSRRRARVLKKRGLEAGWVDAQVSARGEARKAKDFAESDRIRDALGEKGIVLRDTPDGTVWDVEED